MAVYTQVTLAEIQGLADRLDLGAVSSFRGVAAGVENSTYFFSALPKGSLIPCEYVLTIAETIDRSDLDFVAALCQQLAINHLPVPAPLSDGQQAVFKLRGKPAIVVPRMKGAYADSPSLDQCRQLGQALASLHHVTRRWNQTRESHRSLRWVSHTGSRLLPFLSAPERTLLNEELTFLTAFLHQMSELPTAVIHGDLFRDNVLFAEEKLTAIIDFFSAGTSALMLDLAIAANDWCRQEWAFSAARLSGLCAAYSSSRSLSAREIEAWPNLLRIGALRFWVSRLAENYLQDDERPLGAKKNPDEYRDLLLLHRDSPLKWAEISVTSDK